MTVKLEQCPKCKGQVMQHFNVCPHCGEPQGKNLTKPQEYVKLEEDEGNSSNTTVNFRRNFRER